MSNSLFKDVQKPHVLEAIKEIDEKGVRPGRQSSTYDLIYGNKKYPPKYVLSLAGKYANGQEIDPNDFEGGMGTDAFNFLQSLEFIIIPKDKKADVILDLIDRYKAKIRQTKLQNELYKWKLLHQHSGHPDTDTPDFYKELKTINFKNLIYPMGLAVMDHLGREKPEQYRQLFKALFDEKINLAQRIISFNQDTLKLYREIWPDNKLSHHHDERTIATFLCYHNPSKYTFYKNSFYKKYCKMLGISAEKKGKKYVHYLSLVDDLINNYIDKDQELIDLINSFLVPDCFQDNLHKILVQDILYQMLDNSKEEINIGSASVYKISMGDFNSNDFEECLKSLKVLVHRGTKPKGTSSNPQGYDFKDVIKAGDYFYLTHGNNVNGIRILGRITGPAVLTPYNNLGEKGWLERPFEIVATSVKNTPYDGPQKWWTPNDNSTCIMIKKSELEEANKLIFEPYFNVDLKGIPDDENEDELPSIPEMKNEVGAPDMPIKNYILYGPPGTGKTYNSIDKAVELALGKSFGNHEANKREFDELRKKGEIEFITFHPNYTYEDFVLGITPNLTSGQLSFTRKEGIFKQINDRAKNNWLASLNAKNIVTGFEHVFNAFFNKLIQEEVDGVDIPMKSKGYSFRITKIDVEEGRIKFAKKSGGTGHDLLIKNVKDIYEGTLDYSQEGLGVYYYPLDEKLKEFAKSSLTSTSSLEKVYRKNYVLVIDEINRGNVSRIFGELITLLEEDKRLGATNELKITLPGGEKDFGVPPNLYIVGTMNTADKSIALVDIALRRRFEFISKYPSYELLEDSELRSLLQCINEAVYKEKGSADYLIGHAYFMKKQPPEDVLKHRVIPLLMEFCSGKTERVANIFSETDWKVEYDLKTFSWNVNPKDK